MVIDNAKKKKGPEVGEVYVNDFNDGYHKLSTDPSNELERAARKIRRRYRAFDDYKRALAIYVEYMDALAMKYGGQQQFQLRIDSNTVFEFVPPLPKLKKSPINDFITEHKIMISDPNRVTYDNDVLEAYEAQFEDELTANTRIGNEIIKNNDELLRKIVKKGIYGGKLDAKKMKEIDAVDLLASYFDSENTKGKKSKKDKYKDRPSITDIIEDRVPEEEEEEAIFYRGRLMTSSEVAQMKLYQEMNKYGWNSLALMKMGSERDASSSAIASVLRDEEHKRKREKKNKKKGKGSKAANDFLVKMMGDNDENFGDFEEDMLNFTINNIFK